MMRLVKILIVVTCVLMQLVGVSQDAAKKGIVFVSNDYNGGNSVFVKWISDKIYFQDGVDVYRQEGNNAWAKLNSQRVNLQGSIPSDANLSKDDKSMYEFASKASYEDFQGNFVKAFVLVHAIYNPDLAKLIGIQFEDETAEKGKKYKYKVVGYNGSTEIEVGISQEIKVENYVKVGFPEDLSIERKKTKSNIKWKPNLESYYGVDIYRNKDGGEFKKISKKPIAVQKYKKENGKYDFNEFCYVDEFLSPESSYAYKFVAIDYFGQRSDESPEIKSPARDFEPPLAPINLKARPHALDMKVDFTWEVTPVEDLAGYNLYRSEVLDGPYEKANSSIITKEKLVYTDELGMSGRFYYYLTSVDNAGNESKSGKIFTEVRDLIPPDAPKGLEAKTDSGLISLSWKPNTEGDLLGYFVQRSLNDENNLDNHYINVNSKPIIETQWSQKLAKNIRNKFVYRVIAVDTLFNRSGPSINSLAQMPDVTPPKPVQLKTVKPNEENLVIEWVKNSDLDLQEYKIYRKILNDSTSSWDQVNLTEVSPEAFRYTDRSIKRGVNYEYKMQAIDNNGNMSAVSNLVRGINPKLSSDFRIEVIDKKENHKKKYFEVFWKSDMPKDELVGFVVYMSDQSGAMKPYGERTLNNNVKIKATPGKYVVQIRAYMNDGGVFKSERINIEINSDKK